MASATTQNRPDFADTSRGVVHNVTEKAADLADKAGYQVDKALDSAEIAARSVAQQGREAGQRVSEVAGNLKSAVDKSVNDQPMATLVVAAALGFVIGALWKS
jgi:ElaB/YqjD/DUF883 family membrane-anchored ribosome-binding protein